MPRTTIPTTYATMYVPSIKGHVPAAWPVLRDEVGFISQWKLDDISSGSGLDSQGSNHMHSSGNPTQIEGSILESGVQFDGVDDCFYIEWTEGSGLFMGQPALTDLDVNTIGCQMSIEARIKPDADSFNQERVIFSKWNEVGNNREFMLGINPSGGLFVQWQRYNGDTHCVNSCQSGIITPDTWQNVGIIYFGNDTTDDASWAFLVDDKLYWNDLASFYLDYQPPFVHHASGTIHIGAANYGVEPSGFFKGCIEDVRFQNGRHISLDEWNAYTSGTQPQTYRPAISELHPHLMMHIKTDNVQSGVDIGRPYQEQWVLQDRKTGAYIPSSGSASYYDHDLWEWQVGPGSGNIIPSGFAYTGVNSSRRVFLVENVFAPKEWDRIRQGFTVCAWIKRNYLTSSQGLVGWSSYGPFKYALSNGYVGVTHFHDEESGDGEQSVINPSTPPSLEITPLGEWTHVNFTVDFARGMGWICQSGIMTGPDGLGGSGLWNCPVKQQAALYRTFYLYYNNTAGIDYTSQVAMNEIVVFDKPMTQAEASGFYVESSGILALATAQSGIQGGWTFGLDSNRESGYLGGYVVVGTPNEAYLAGYTSGTSAKTSGMLGGYIRIGTPNEATLGGWMTGKNEWDALISAYTKTKGTTNLTLGAYVVGSETAPVQSEFYAFFNVIGRNKSEFDAQVAAYKSLRAEFDAKAIIYIDEEKPGVNILTPNIPETSGSVPLTVNFEAEASGLDGKHIVLTYWFFSDVPTTSGSTTSASGTYQTSHTFGQSGVFTVTFVAVDNQGLVNSDRVIINTASGLSVAEAELTATPESGTAPLSVAFSGIVSNVPAGTSITEKYIQFGDGTFSASTDSIYKLYPVVGCYLPTFRVRDSRGVIVTDTIVVGVNN